MNFRDEELHDEVMLLLSRVGGAACTVGDKTLVLYDAFKLVRSVKDCTLLASKRIVWQILKDYGGFMELSRLPEGAVLCRFPGRTEESIGMTLEAAVEMLFLLPESDASRNLRQRVIDNCIFGKKSCSLGTLGFESPPLSPGSRGKTRKRSARSRMSTRIQLVFCFCCVSAAVTFLALDRQPSSAWLRDTGPSSV
jgi:hypothetical protein